MAVYNPAIPAPIIHIGRSSRAGPSEYFAGMGLYSGASVGGRTSGAPDGKRVSQRVIAFPTRCLATRDLKERLWGFSSGVVAPDIVDSVCLGLRWGIERKLRIEKHGGIALFKDKMTNASIMI